MCFTWISEQTAIISVYSINLPVFKTEAEGVYCAVRTRSLNQTYSFVLKELIDPLKTKRRLLYLKTQFVPRSKHFSSRL